jgi:hypothetical protein
MGLIDYVRCLDLAKYGWHKEGMQSTLESDLINQNIDS